MTPGLPDVIAFLPRVRDDGSHARLDLSVLLFIEVKSARGRLRLEQAQFRACCELADIAHVVGGLDAVIAWLLEHGYLKSEQVAHYRRPIANETPGVRLRVEGV